MSQRSKMAQSGRPVSMGEVADAVGVYPVEAYDFLQKGLRYTVGRVHGNGSGVNHVSGHQLALGLRDYAHSQWGLMARAVLARWNITTTFDFGRMVFALIEAGIFHKTEEDNIEDFRNVFDFAEFDQPYCFESRL